MLKDKRAWFLFLPPTVRDWEGRPMSIALQGKNHFHFYSDRFAKNVEEGSMEIFEGDGATLIASQPDASYDMIYIDGNHVFEAVARDAAVSMQKIKPSGTLIFNDYIMHDYLTNVDYGVVHAVHDLCANHGWVMTHIGLSNGLFNDVALRRS